MAAAIDPAALYGPGGPLENMTQAEANEWLASAIYSGDKGNSLGPFLMGFAIDMFFFGVVVTQFLRWLSLAHPDRKFVKTIVWSSFILAVTYSVVAICYQMRNFVYNYGKYAVFAEMAWLTIFVALEGVVAVFAQTFYADRAYRLLGPQRAVLRNVFLFLFIVSVMVELGGAMGAVVLANTKVNSLIDAYKIEKILYVWLGGQLAADVLITGVTGWGLWRSKTGWSNTDKIIKRLIMFTVETQLPPTVIALVYMVYYSQNPLSTLIIALNYAMCKPYLIGILAVLNDRVNIRNEMTGFATTENNNTYQLKSTRHQQATVHVHTETYTESHPNATLRVGLNRQTSEEFDKEYFKDNNSDFKGELGDSRTHLNRV